MQLFVKLNRVLLLIYISNKCYLIMCIICNPPFNQCVLTNILKVFLKFLDKNFRKSSILHKIFNRNSIKVNYSCTQNHDMRILNSRTQNCLPYNCQKKEEHGVLQVSPPPFMSNPPPPLGLSTLPTSIDSPHFPFSFPQFPFSRILAIDSSRDTPHIYFPYLVPELYTKNHKDRFFFTA